MLYIFRELLILKEDTETERRITNCDVTDRERHLYISQSNAIEKLHHFSYILLLQPILFRELLILKEDTETERRITNCDVTDRERHLYTSKSNHEMLHTSQSTAIEKTAPLFLYIIILLILQHILFRELLILKEDTETERRITNCDVTDRERHLYTSKSNAIEIRLLASNMDAPQFLIEYTGIWIFTSKSN